MLFFLVLVAGLAIIILWVSRIFYVLQKGLNEIITGLSSIDQRLARLEDRAGASAAGRDAGLAKGSDSR